MPPPMRSAMPRGPPAACVSCARPAVGGVHGIESGDPDRRLVWDERVPRRDSQLKASLAFTGLTVGISTRAFAISLLRGETSAVGVAAAVLTIDPGGGQPSCLRSPK